MTAEDLWRIFSQECRKLYIMALVFDGYSSNTKYTEPPPDLTLWENALAAINKLIADENNKTTDPGPWHDYH